jgi:DeoR family fructose operon transcriptional repressor
VEASQRRESILEALQRDGYVRLSSLSEELQVAPVTIHRDLDLLEAEGSLERIRGGARVVGGASRIRTDYETREAQMVPEKASIAQRALREVPDGATLFLDSSTTVLALGKILAREAGRGLTIVTNSPALAFQLMAPHIHVVVLPGELNQSLRAITGRWTAEFLEQLSITVAFVSAAGFTAEKGLMTTQRELAEVTKAAFARADSKIALVDSSKFGVSALVTMATPDELDLVITDERLGEDVLDEYRSAGVNLIRSSS